jgi:hypothetical protein
MAELIVKARRFASDQYRKLRDESDPQWYRFAGHPSHAASEAIRRAGERFKIGYGVEGFCWNNGEDGITYLNMGDTYEYTVLFDSRTGRFSTGCWGDVVEQLERDGITLE